MTRRHLQQLEQLINSLIHSDGGSKLQQLNADTDRAFVLLSAALPRWTPLGHERCQVWGDFCIVHAGRFDVSALRSPARDENLTWRFADNQSRMALLVQSLRGQLMLKALG